jgi:hypothetical protein
MTDKSLVLSWLFHENHGVFKKFIKVFEITRMDGSLIFLNYFSQRTGTNGSFTNSKIRTTLLITNP